MKHSAVLNRQCRKFRIGRDRPPHLPCNQHLSAANPNGDPRAQSDKRCVSQPRMHDLHSLLHREMFAEAEGSSRCGERPRLTSREDQPSPYPKDSSTSQGSAVLQSPNCCHTHKATDWRQAQSSAVRPSNASRSSRPCRYGGPACANPERNRRYDKPFPFASCRSKPSAPAQKPVDRPLERIAGALNLLLHELRHIIVNGKSRPHIMMLTSKTS